MVSFLWCFLVFFLDRGEFWSEDDASALTVASGTFGDSSSAAAASGLADGDNFCVSSVAVTAVAAAAAASGLPELDIFFVYVANHLSRLELGA